VAGQRQRVGEGAGPGECAAATRGRSQTWIESRWAPGAFPMTRELAVNGVALPGSGRVGPVAALAGTLAPVSVRPAASTAAPTTAWPVAW
jgi:hypothetical protein